ncbi:DNA polymerase [Candidatus Gracilibacteria bacterium]|nr:DNA polymerase [Candidatus Gracilibacteria bacterium]
MAKFFDIKLRSYIFDKYFKGVGFGEYLENTHNFGVSPERLVQNNEKAIFSFNDSGKVNLPQTKEFGLDFVFGFESELLEVLAKMEFEGVSIDSEKLAKIGEEIEIKTKKIEAEIYEVVGEKFNINSAKQVQEILFEKLKIPTSKKIKTGFSVDNEALSFIAKDYAIASLILDYRGLQKLQSTYVQGLLKVINKQTGKIHTTYNQIKTSTGRLSSENPNLQNIPSGDFFSDEIKSCFIPSSPDYEILVADYSQVELRILANLSGDPELTNAFLNSEDIHNKTAKFLFGENTTITSELRRRAKTVNFGVIYGISGFGLSKTMNVSMAEATEYINKFFEKYSRVKTYYENVLEKARQTGYVETFFGRRRYINGLNDANRIIKGQAEREALNMPIQGTSADIIKLAMIKIDNFLKEKNLKSKLIMQVHDELVFEIHKTELQLVQKEIREIMENIHNFPIKLLVDISIGENWKKAKE